jgi:hypothetical protein
LVRLEQREVEWWACAGKRRWTTSGVLPLGFFKRRRGVGNGRRREELERATG